MIQVVDYIKYFYWGILGVDTNAFLQEIIHKSFSTKEKKANCLEFKTWKNDALCLCNHIIRTK